MKYSVSILFFVVFTFGFSSAQEFADKDFYLVDSVVLSDLSEYDRNLIDSLMHLYQNEEQDTTKLELLKLIIHRSSDLNYTQKLAKVLKKEALQLEASTNSERVAHLAKFYVGVYHMNKAFAYSNYGSSDELYINSLDSAASIFSEINEPTPLVAVMIYKAFHFQEIGLYKKAIDVYQEAILTSEKIDFLNGQIQAYYGIGTIYMELDKIDNALTNIEKSLALAEIKESVLYQGRNLLVIAQIYLQKDSIKLAEIEALKAININEKINNLEGTAQGKYLLGKIAIKNKDFEKSGILFDENIATYTQLKDHSGLSLNLLAKAELNFENALYPSAKLEATKAYELALKHNHIVRLQLITKLLADINDSLNLTKESNTMLRLNLMYTDSIFNSKTKEASINQEIEYQYEKQKEIDDLKNQQQLDLAEEQKQRTRLGMFAAAIIASLIALFSLFIFNRLKLIRKQKTALDDAYLQLEDSKKNELAVSNLKALQSQMNPHFIFNALNSVQDLVLLKDVRASNKFLGKFSDLIRKILLSSKEQFISLAEEVEILQLYLDLEKLRFGEDFEIDFECNVSQQKQDEILLPAMFIQPYIENAIKHGLFHKEGKKELMVHFNLKENTLECIVKDNGVGQEKANEFKQKRLHLHTGFSTEAINERIRLLNETLDKKIDLQIIDLEENGVAMGTKIILLFPI